MMNKLSQIIFSSLTLLSPASVWAQQNTSIQLKSPKTPLGATLSQALAKIFDVVIVIAGIVFVVLLLVGGVQYLTAAGDEDNTKKAMKLMIDGLVGLLIVLFAYPTGKFLLDQLGIQ